MDDLLIVISAMTLAACISGIIFFLVNATGSGGIFYGKYITKTNPHYCNYPNSFDGDNGDRWQCRKCKTIWKQTGYRWRNESNEQDERGMAEGELSRTTGGIK